MLEMLKIAKSMDEYINAEQKRKEIEAREREKVKSRQQAEQLAARRALRSKGRGTSMVLVSKPQSSMSPHNI